MLHDVFCDQHLIHQAEWQPRAAKYKGKIEGVYKVWIDKTGRLFEVRQLIYETEDL